MSSKKKIDIWLMLILLIGVILASIYCYCDNITGDEVFSIGFANNTRDFLFMSEGVRDSYSVNGWLPGEFINEYFSVQPGEQFSIMSIHRNVREDVHPPLYFMLLNAVSSFWLNRTTATPGHLINIFASIVMMILIFGIGRKINSGKVACYLAPLVWMSSMGAVHSIQYIRMYLTLGVLCVAVLLLSINIMDNHRKRLYVLMGVLVTIGTLTHYYFYVFSFWAIAYVSLYFIRNKKYRSAFLYWGCIAIGELISLLAYPYVFIHILGSDRGEQVQQNLSNTSLSFYFEQLKGFIETFNSDVFNDCGNTIIVLVLILAIINAVRKRLNGNTGRIELDSKAKRNIGLITTCVLGYFIVLLKISYSSRWLYISPIFAPVVLLLVWLFETEIMTWKKKDICLVIICSLYIIAGAIIHIEGCINEYRVYIGREMFLSEQVKGKQVFYIYNDITSTLGNQGTVLLNADNVAFISEAELESYDFAGMIERCPGNTEDVIFYFLDDIDMNNIDIDLLVKNLEVKNEKCIWNDRICAILANR